MTVLRYGYSQKCDCQTINMLKDILLSEMMERKMLESRVAHLESSSDDQRHTAAIADDNHVSDNRLLELETKVDSLTTEVLAQREERQELVQMELALRSQKLEIHKLREENRQINLTNSNFEKDILKLVHLQNITSNNIDDILTFINQSPDALSNFSAEEAGNWQARNMDMAIAAETSQENSEGQQEMSVLTEFNNTCEKALREYSDQVKSHIEHFASKIETTERDVDIINERIGLLENMTGANMLQMKLMDKRIDIIENETEVLKNHVNEGDRRIDTLETNTTMLDIYINIVSQKVEAVGRDSTLTINQSNLMNDRLRQTEITTVLAVQKTRDVIDKIGALERKLETDGTENMKNLERETERKLQQLQSQSNTKLQAVQNEVYRNFTVLKTSTEESFQLILDYLEKHKSSSSSSLSVSVDYAAVRSTLGALFGIRMPQENGIAFTVYGSVAAQTFSTASIRFDKVILNVGGHYDSSVGYFVCPKAGLYYFAVTLTKKRVDIDLVTAYLAVENTNKLQLHSDPDDPGTTDFGSYSISGAGTFSLNRGDWVYVTGNSSHFYDDNRSFFTGFIIG